MDVNEIIRNTLTLYETQHIKFEILREGLSSFYCNLIQKNFVLNMFSTDQICNENFHPFDNGMMTSLKVWMFPTGKLLNQLF